MLVAEAMTAHPVTMPPTATVAQAAAQMRDHDIGDVLVVDSAGHLQGIVTDRDLTVRLAADGRPTSAKIKEAMSTDCCTIGPSAGIEAAVELMRTHALRRVPVVDDEGTPVGVLSLGDAAHVLDPKSALAAISHAPANN